MPARSEVLAREREHHDRLYSGFAQAHFAQPAVAAFRRHFARRFFARTGAGPASRVLSIGCGIGDFELLLAGRVGFLFGVDLSPAAIDEARRRSSGVPNLRFECADYAGLEAGDGGWDIVLAKFFLHHLNAEERAAFAAKAKKWLRVNGLVYSLDPNKYRLSGAVGRLAIPQKMARYQTDDEQPVSAAELRKCFEEQGFRSFTRMYDFGSTPLAGLFPKWLSGYRLARAVDDALVRIPGVRSLGSNVEMVSKVLV